MSVDHCFSIKGQGTVMTGTILSGSVSLGDSVEIPALKVSLASPHVLWAPLEQ